MNIVHQVSLGHAWIKIENGMSLYDYVFWGIPSHHSSKPNMLPLTAVSLPYLSPLFDHTNQVVYSPIGGMLLFISDFRRGDF